MSQSFVTETFGGQDVRHGCRDTEPYDVTLTPRRHRGRREDQLFADLQYRTQAHR